MNITGRWDAVSLTGEGTGPYITVTGETLTTTITIDNDRQVSINIIDLSSPLGVGVDVDTAYEAVIGLEAQLTQVFSVWSIEQYLKDKLLSQVSLVGWGGRNWLLQCNDEGLYWQLLLKPGRRANITVTVYLDIDLDADLNLHERTVTRRYICLEARDIHGVVAEIHAIDVPKDVLIIDDQLVRDYLPQDYIAVKDV
jgi:hypothetical protein